MGRSLQNSLINLGIENKYKEALLDLGYVLEDIYEEVRGVLLFSRTRKKTPHLAMADWDDSLPAT